MTITDTDIEIAHLWGQFDEINTILSAVEDQQRRLELRYKKAELTGLYWKLQQDRRRNGRRE